MNVFDVIEKKTVLILGFGREGISTYNFIRSRFPKKHMGIADKKKLKDLKRNIRDKLIDDINLSLYFGKNYLSKLNDFELVIKTPGIPNKLKEIINAKQKGVLFTSQTKIFLQLCRGNIIGITGTKGKSTTASLIYHLLRQANDPAIILGNIGKPPIDYIYEGNKDTYFVFEMSSHQLVDVDISPHLAVFLNIYPEHLDYYIDYKDYLNAKSNITKYQKLSDYFIYNADFSEIKKIAKLSNARKFSFSLKTKVKNGCYLKNEKIDFLFKGKKEYSFDVNKIKLSGIHNINNVMASIIAARITGVDFKSIDKALQTFKPLEGRLEFVGIYQNILFVNDTLATIPEATMAALETFKDKHATLILGGYDRNISFNKLGKKLSKSKNILNIILIGQTANKIKNCLRENKFKGKVYSLGKTTMDQVVRKSVSVTPSGGVVLLSPATASFDMFKDYKDRGDQFKTAISGFFHE